MAWDSAYATAEEFKAQGGSTGAYSAAAINRALKAVSRALDAKLLDGYSFNDSVDPMTVILVPESDPLTGYAPTILRTPPIYEADDLEIIIDTDGDGTFDEAPLALTDYALLPRNGPLLADPSAYNEIALLRTGSVGAWPIGGLVQLTARLGWPGGVPDGIVFATIELARMALGEGIFATGQVPELSTLETASPQARSILKSLYMAYSPDGGIAVG